MSFLTGLLGFVKPALGFLTGKGLGSQIVRTVLTGLALKKLYSSNQQESNQESSIQEEQPDFGVRLTKSADPSQKIPVVYGTAWIGGKLVDVRMTDNNQTMWYALVFCERTGTVLSTTTQSVITFKDIYWDNSRVVFKADGNTLDYTVDVNGKQDYSSQGLVNIYCFNNGSINPTNVEDFASQSAYAYSLMPSWTSTDKMMETVFALIKVQYDKENSTAGLGSITAKLQNTMTKPGDCLYDLMTNTRYGASIAAGDIKT